MCLQQSNLEKVLDVTEEVARRYYQIAVASVMERKQEAVCSSDLYAFIKQLLLSCIKSGFLWYS